MKWDTDVLSASFHGNKIAWYENGGGSVELSGPAEVTVGVPFDLSISCANANALIRVAAGRNDQGSSRFVPGCGVISFGIGPRPNNG